LTLGLTLTSAETRVLKLLGVGLSNAEMAQRLSVSKNTIRSHLKKIYRSLGCHDRLKVAIWAFSLSSGKKDTGSD
jgi:DNA-binding NarL/FixJ family response regulator